MKFADPTNDFAFKKLFADPKNKHMLISFLNAMLERKGDKCIADAIVSDPNNLPLIKGDKHSIVDVRCTDERGKKYIVEVQVEDQKDFAQRCVYYSSRTLASQLQSKQKYTDITPVIFLGILNFNMFSNSEYINHYLIMNSKTHEVGLTMFEWHFAELQKFNKTEDELKNDAERWMFLFKNSLELDHIPKSLTACKETSDAMVVLDKHLWAENDLEVYERILDAERVAQSILETAVGKSRVEGMQQGMQKGMQKGEAAKTKVIAKQMMEKGLDVKLISEVTGLSVDEINKLN